MLSYLFIAVVIVLVFAYFKNLSKEQRAAQASVIRDVASIGVVATATLGKEAITATYKAGSLAAKTVEAEHASAIHTARQSVDNVIKSNGGTVNQAGVALGHKAANATYITDANSALDKALAELQAKGF